MKSSLLLVGLLFFSTAAQAQHTHQPLMSGGGAAAMGGSIGGWGSGGAWGSGNGTIGRAVHYQDPRNFSLVYVQNDGPFVPSSYMSYEEAVSLGQQQLAAAEKAAQGDGAPSLGEVAREYRTTRVPTLKLQSRVLQDNFGRLEVCNLNGNDCHRP